MITVRQISGRRRAPVFSPMRGLGGFTPMSVMLPSAAPRSAMFQQSVVAAPLEAQRQESLNIPAVPQPSVMQNVYRTAKSQAYGSGSAGGANGGTVGGEDTQTAFFVLQAEDNAGPDPAYTGEEQHTFLQDADGNVLDSEGRPVGQSSVESVSTQLAPQGSFLKTWGPPLLAVAGIGLAVWVLRR